MEQSKLNLRELVFGWPTNIRYVNRYSTSRCVRPENVAEHTGFVCLYAAVICHWLWEQFYDELYSFGTGGMLMMDKLCAEVMIKAAMHDLEECRTGDIHRPFKYSDPQLKQALDKASDLAMDQIVDRLVVGSDFRRRFKETWRRSKMDEAGAVVQFADFLSVLNFVHQEGPAARERLNLETMREHFAKFQESTTFDFLRPLIDEAALMVKEVLGE